MGSTGVQKDINELKRLVTANGFKFVPNGSGHLKLLNKKGQVVIDDDGPVIMSTSASDHRARDMHVKRLLGVGALKTDPYKPQEKMSEKEKSKRPDPQSPEMRQKRKDAETARSKERAELTRKLRGRVEPFIMSIGGWEKKGVAAEFTRAVMHFLALNNRVENWGTDASAQQSTYQLRHGNTLSTQRVDAYNLFMDEIERAGSTVEARRAHYFEIVRASKGIPTAQVSAPAPGGVTSPVKPDVERLLRQAETGSEVEAVTPKTNGRKPYRTPTLALKALAEMMVGTQDGTGLLPASDERRERALGIAEEILDMEIQTMLGHPTGVTVPGAVEVH